MTFQEHLDGGQVLLTEGAVIERLRRTATVRLDPHVLHASLIYEPTGRAALEQIYRSYLDVGQEFNLPMIVSPPTWRANPERLTAAGFAPERDVNGDACRFLDALRATYGTYGEQVYIGGLMGCRGDAYDPRAALSRGAAAEFHRTQAKALAAAGVDFLMAATLPALSEAVGIAETLAANGLPYVISVVVRPMGTLLDGTPLVEFVTRIDGEISPAPSAYLVNCTHPTNFREALRTNQERMPAVHQRVIGLQANTSQLSPEELEGSAELHPAAPMDFAEELHALRCEFGMRILGGCCGTDARHIRALAARLIRKT